jgi:poly(3-hydroxyoctanoate) depolymerase
MAALLMLSATRYLSKSAAQWMVPRIAGGRTRRDPSSLESQLAERLANPPSKRGYIDQLYAITGWSSLPWLHEIRMPTLILHGDDDPMVPVDNARRMASLMPQANLHIVPGGGHLFMIDEPESVTDELFGFLANG